MSGQGQGRVTRVTRVFVDQIEDDRAVVEWEQITLSLPTRLLPDGAREGDWIELSARVIAPPPSDAEAVRKHLVADDPGGPLKL